MPSGPIGTNDLAELGVTPDKEGLAAKNVFAGTVTRGTLVYINGTTTNPATGADPFPTFTKADADGTAPANVAMYVVAKDVAQNGFTKLARALVVRGVDTSTYTTVGDPAYLSATAGETTPTAPTASNATVQRVGYCAKKDASAGILVYDLRSAPVQSFGTQALTGVVADQAAGAVSAANFGVPVQVSLTIPAGVTGNVDFTGWPFKMRVRRVFGIKTAAAGGGAGTVQVQNGTGGNNITNAVSIDVADETILNAGTIADAFQDIAAGATVRVVRTRTASTNEACVLTLVGDRVA